MNVEMKARWRRERWRWQMLARSMRNRYGQGCLQMCGFSISGSDPLPTQLHPFIKEPMGTKKLIVCPGICAPCCRADLLTPGPLPSAHHSSSAAPLSGSASMNLLWIGQCVVNSPDSALGPSIYEMSQTTSEACCVWTNSNGIPLRCCGQALYNIQNNIYTKHLSLML